MSVALTGGVLIRVFAQSPRPLTLEDAEKIALRNEPRIASAKLTASAAGQNISEARSVLFPTLSANITGVGAEAGSAVAAGAVTTSSLSSRAAGDVVVSQLLTDFGRTSSLVSAARLKAESQNQSAEETRALVLLNVRIAYYHALSAHAVETVAQAALDSRNLITRQIRALAASSLKSTLDVHFAEVAASQAELALYQAQNDSQSAIAQLSSALGYDRSQMFTLADTPLTSAPASDPASLIADALQRRPDLAAVKLNADAARQFAEAERRLRYPTISALGVAGEVPVHEPGLHGNFAGAGVNVSIPVFNGGLFSARQTEAELKAQAAEKDAQEMIIEVSRDVQIALLNANDVYRRLDVTARMVAEADEALRLARARYEIGLGSIVELTQAQYSQTTAQIAAARARYDFLSATASLDFSAGALR